MDSRSDQPDDLLREHADGVRRLARHLVHDIHDADDIAQESLLAAAGRTPRRIKSLGAWLRGIVRNKALQFRRTEGRRRIYEGHVRPSGESADTSDVVAHLEIQERLVAALRAMPPPYRTVLWFRYFEDASAREIATRLALPVETVRTRIKRGVKMLRLDLDERSGGRRAAWMAALIPVLPKGGLTTALAMKGALTLMTTKTTLVGAIAVALAIGAGALATGLWTSEGEAPPARGASVDGSAVPPRPPDRARPQLLGQGTPPSEVRREAPAPTDDAHARIHGRVLTKDTMPVPEAVVSVVEGPGLKEGDGPPWHILGEALTNPQGRYEVRVDLPAPDEGESARTVLVVADADGFRRRREPITLSQRATRTDFVLDRGLALGGTVVDPDGRPLANLPVKVATLSRPPHMIYGSLLWATRKRLATTGDDYLEAEAVTDERGRFLVRGLGVGRYGVISQDLRWFIKQSGLIEIERDREPAPATLVAVPARAIRGTVRDAVTGNLLSKGLVSFHFTAPCGDNMGSYASVSDGSYVTGWAFEDEMSGRVAVRAEATAKGYKNTRMDGVLSPEAPILTLDFKVDPILEEKGTVVLTVTDPRGAPLPGHIAVWARRLDDEGVRLQRRRPPERQGVFRIELPAGTYDLVVEPFHVLGSKTQGRCQVKVRAGQETSARVEVGGGATLRLRLPLADGVPVRSGLSIDAIGERTHRTAGASTDLTLEEKQMRAGEDLVWAGWLPGTWRFRLTWGDQEIVRTVQLEEGDDVLLDFR